MPQDYPVAPPKTAKNRHFQWNFLVLSNLRTQTYYGWEFSEVRLHGNTPNGIFLKLVRISEHQNGAI